VTHRGPCQPPTFCDSVIHLAYLTLKKQNQLSANKHTKPPNRSVHHRNTNVLPIYVLKKQRPSDYRAGAGSSAHGATATAPDQAECCHCVEDSFITARRCSAGICIFRGASCHFQINHGTQTLSKWHQSSHLLIPCLLCFSTRPVFFSSA